LTRKASTLPALFSQVLVALPKILAQVFHARREAWRPTFGLGNTEILGRPALVVATKDTAGIKKLSIKFLREA
jgi:hypothetical protein